ncbi:hypothetical protein ACXYUI_34050, partial [Klebsiella pneumoniae]
RLRLPMLGDSVVITGRLAFSAHFGGISVFVKHIFEMDGSLVSSCVDRVRLSSECYHLGRNSLWSAFDGEGSK